MFKSKQSHYFIACNLVKWRWCFNMDDFITTHLYGKEVDVYCGGPDWFKGKVVGASNNILTLESKKGVYTHITTDKIIALWLKDQPWPKPEVPMPIPQ